MDIGFTVIGDLKVAQKFQEFPHEAHDALLGTIATLTKELEARVRSAAPSRTGKLRSSIVSQVYDNAGGTRIRGVVTVSGDFAKAATLEYGSHRKITVNRSGAGARGRQGHLKISAALSRQRDKIAAAYQRQTNIVATRFLRGSVAAMQGEIAGRLRAAIEQAVVALQAA